MMLVILMMIFISQNKMITLFMKAVLSADQVATIAIKFKWVLLIKVAFVIDNKLENIRFYLIKIIVYIFRFNFSNL